MKVVMNSTEVTTRADPGLDDSSKQQLSVKSQHCEHTAVVSNSLGSSNPGVLVLQSPRVEMRGVWV